MASDLLRDADDLGGIRIVGGGVSGVPRVRRDEHIYHALRSAYYGRVRLNVDAGERWFCDEAADQAAGWRPARSR